MTGRQDTVQTTLGLRLMLFVLVSAATACHGRSVEQVETTAVVPVAVAIAEIGPLRATIPATGVVSAAPGAELLVVAPAAGRIAQLPHAEGDRVKQGDVLVRFDVPALTADLSASRARVTQASARVAAAHANVKRLTSLLDQGVAAPRDVEDATRQSAEAEGDLEQAQSAVAAASALSDRSVVRAPFAGVIAQRFHNPGDLVEAAASDPVVRLIDPSRLQVVAAVPAAELSRIAVGHTASVRVPGAEEGEEAKVLVRAPQVDPAAGTGHVRLGFIKPTSLTAGMSVQVEIVAEERAHVVTIPAAALVIQDDERYVMVVDTDSKAHKRPVTVGLTTRTTVEVARGVTAGERVIVRGQDGVPDGAAVAVEDK
jgi:RND family efflux transporter MFP subunit